jgi:signal transduction histidine kinase
MSNLLVLLLGFIHLISPQSFEDSLKQSVAGYPEPANQVEYLNCLTDGYRISGNYGRALKTGKLAVELVEGNKLLNLYSKTYSFLGLVYRDMNRYADAEDCFEKALSAAVKMNQKEQIAWGYNNLATIDRILSKYTDAIDKIYKALAVFEQLNHAKGKSHCYINLGILYRYQKDYEKSLECLNNAISIREKINDARGIAQAKYLIGETYYEAGQFEKALKYYMESEEYYKKAGQFSDFTRSILYMAYGGAYYELKQYERSLDYKLKALDLNLKLGNRDNLSRIHLSLGKIYERLNNYPAAELHLKKALEYADDISLRSRKREITQALADFYYLRNNPVEAYKYLKQYAELNDSIYSERSKELMAKLETEYRTKEKEKENELLSAKLKIESQKIWFLSGISLMLIVSVAALFYFYKKTKEQNNRLVELNDTKDLLFSIISHDIKNPFGVIISASEFLHKDNDTLDEEERRQLSETVYQSSRNIYALLNNLLKWSQNQRELLKVEFTDIILSELVDENIKLLFGQAKEKNIELVNNVPENITARGDRESVSLVVRNLLNNAIKFSDGGKVEINAREDRNRIYVEVSDSGVGIPEARLKELFKVKKSKTTAGTSGEKGTGLGLILCKDLVEINGGEISVSSELGKGSKFVFSLYKSGGI